MMRRPDPSSLLPVWGREKPSCQSSALVPALLAGLGALAQLRALRRYRQIPALGSSRGLERPLVSVVVPARDEESNLRTLLPSLAALRYEPRELIVVDDDSTDGTARIAAEYGATVVSTGGSPPEGWAGKTWAMERGFRASSGEWLLLLDADTWLAPDCLGAAVDTALADRLDTLSLILDQRCVGLAERALLPFAYAGYFAGVGRTLNTRPSDALLNGQFVLIRRSVYESIGGHRQVAGSIVEDAALGKVLLWTGYRVGLYRAAGQAAVRMYSSTSGLLEGFGKNSFGMVRVFPARGLRVALATSFASSTGAALGLGLLDALRQRKLSTALRVLLAPLVAYALGVAAQAGWSREFGVPRGYALLQPLAGLVFLTIALRSAVSTIGGPKVSWKGRLYRS